MTRNFYIYICQGSHGNHAVRKREGFEWPGDSPTDAVQRLQNLYPWYNNDLFVVVEVNQDGDVAISITAIRVKQDGHAFVEELGA